MRRSYACILIHFVSGVKQALSLSKQASSLDSVLIDVNFLNEQSKNNLVMVVWIYRIWNIYLLIIHFVIKVLIRNHDLIRQNAFSNLMFGSYSKQTSWPSMFAHDLLLFAYKQREDTTYIFNQIATTPSRNHKIYETCYNPFSTNF